MNSRLAAMLGLFFLSCSSVFAISTELEEAHSYFDQRSNKEMLAKAKKLYEKIIIKNNNIEEKTIAFDRYARLAFLEGQLAQNLWGKAPKNTPKIFEGCISLSRYLNKETTGQEIPEYYYWRAVCIGLWAKNANMFYVTMKTGLVLEMIDLIKYGEQHFPEFRYNGFSLLRAGLSIRSSAFKIINQYNPERALKVIQKIKQNGFEDYTVYLIEAEAQLALRHKKEARAILLFAIQELEKNLQENNISSLLNIESQGLLNLLRKKEKKIK